MNSIPKTLRVRNGARIFGPLSLANVQDLVAQGRLGSDASLSDGDGPWVPLAEGLARLTAAPLTSSALAGSPLAVGPPVPAAVDRPTLRVLREGRLFLPMTKAQVQTLRNRGRICGDDLIRALDGPWMPLADFFASRPPSPRPPPVGLEHAPESEREFTAASGTAADGEKFSPEFADDFADHARFEGEFADPAEFAGQAEEFADPTEFADVEDTLAEFSDEDELEEAQPPPISLPPVVVATNLRDEWYVRVRGMHSAPLKKHHVRSLLLARELTPDCAAHHATWRDTDWRPVRSIPQLADLVREIR